MKVAKTVGYSELGQRGRLGNQLWQAASTIGIAKSMGAKPCLPASWDYRQFLSIPDEFFSNEPADIEANDTPLAKKRLDVRYVDYLQDFNLWKDYQEEIFGGFQLNKKTWDLLEEKYSWFDKLKRPILSLHVRRGDNVYDPGVPDKHLYYPLRPITYYIEAVEQLKGTFNSVLVFSDDIPWCQEQLVFQNLNASFFTGGDVRKKEHEVGYKEDPFNDWEDLYVQSWCDRHVIGNSSFAWWGAWLSGDDKVRYSEPWYGPKLDYIDYKLMIPEGWQGININAS